jgi:hypothetical protein
MIRGPRDERATARGVHEFRLVQRDRGRSGGRSVDGQPSSGWDAADARRGTKVSLILLSPADVIPSTCGSGGTGRRASLRSLFPKGSGGSSPLFRTTLRSRRSVNLGTVFCPRLARAEPFGPIRDPPSHRGAAATPTQSVDVRRQAVQYYVCPRMPRLTGSGLDIHLLREGRLADADEAETLSIQRIRLATGGVRRSTLEGAELYRATVEMTADGQVS